MITHLVVGPAAHGVTRYAARVAQADAGHNPVVRLETAAGHGDVAGQRVLCHFTDRLFGDDAAQAARRLTEVCLRAGRVTVVLHDLPQPSDGAAHRRRRHGYLQVCNLADDVVVNSSHEALLLRALARSRGEVWADGLRRRTHVVPLPVPGLPGATRPDPCLEPTVATLGYLYPGKGVEDVITAVGRLSPRPRLVNLGGVSCGHDDLVGALAEQASALDVPWSTTGWLGDVELLARMRAVTVPVAAHRHLSASGSISSWLGAGRRPIVARSRYAVEMAQRMPGALTVVDALAPAIAAALVDPVSTWLLPGHRPGLSEEQVALRLVRVAEGRR